jgi:hypothetical protein
MWTAETGSVLVAGIVAIDHRLGAVGIDIPRGPSALGRFGIVHAVARNVSARVRTVFIGYVVALGPRIRFR